MNLQDRIKEIYARETKEFGEEYFRAFGDLKAALNEGTVCAAVPSRRVILQACCRKVCRG